MKLIELTLQDGKPVDIPVWKITGITALRKEDEEYGLCFVATGADGEDGEANGWYVVEKRETVKNMLEAILDFK